MNPSSSSNLVPTTMQSFTSVNASKYALPMSAPHMSRLLSFPKFFKKLLQNRYFQLVQELDGHLPLI